tara:strand:+ start:1418 stop:1831 length:414 start_codon:yes stop_codon:yes gene_type:complete
MNLTDALVGQTDVATALAYLTEMVPGPRRLVPVSSVKAWALKQGTLMYDLKVVRDGGGPVSPLADTILEAIGVNMPDWNMEDSENVALMDQAVSAGILTLQQKAELVALADTKIPRWRDLGLTRMPVRWEVEEVING